MTVLTKEDRIKARYGEAYVCTRCNTSFKTYDQDFNRVPKTNFLKKYYITIGPSKRISLESICYTCQKELTAAIEDLLK